MGKNLREKKKIGFGCFVESSAWENGRSHKELKNYPAGNRMSWGKEVI